MTHLVWDMDGTLLDSTEVVPDAFIAAVRELGFGDVDRQQVVAAYSLGVPEVVLEHLIGRPLADGEGDLYYDRLQDSSVDAYDGVDETLATLRARGLPVAIFTGASSRAAHTLLGTADIVYDVLIGGDHIANPKPSPDGLLAAANELEVDVAELVYIGDAPTDLQAARAAGSRSAAATWGHLYQPSEPADFRLTKPRSTDA